MSFGVFVQVNEESPKGRGCPLGYVVEENGCWTWVGAYNTYGYGKWRIAGRLWQAHRAMYERAKGSVPAELHLDHICRNRGCVNPDHLEPVTCQVNVLRGVGMSARHAKKTHCPLGHEYSDSNTYRPDRGGRQCRICRRLSDAKRAPRRAK